MRKYTPRQIKIKFPKRDDGQIDIWQQKPRPTLADEVRELKDAVGRLTVNVKVLKCEVENMKRIMNNS